KMSVLPAPVNGTVNPSSVIADYQYARTDVRARVGTVVEAEGKTYTITGLELHEPDGPSNVKVEVVKDQNILLPLRAADTKLSLSIPQQKVPIKVEVDGKEVEKELPVSAVTLDTTADKVKYEKQTLTTDAYIQLFTMHATIMVFFVLM